MEGIEAIKRQKEIEKALHRFTADADLQECCQSLLDCLNIKYTIIDPSTQAASFFFARTSVENNEDLLGKISNMAVVGVATHETFLSEDRLTISRDEMEQKLKDDHYREMLFISFDTSEPLTRTEISMATRAINRKMFFKPVVLLIRSGNLLSISTCERMEYVRAPKTPHGEKVGTVTILRNIDCKHPHHGHVSILSSLDASECEPSFESLYGHWLETFNNEILTRRFYQELSDWYAWAIKNVSFPNELDNHNAKKNERFNNENVIRLVTRLIFVWFLKEKHLIPEEFFDADYIGSNLLKDFSPNTSVGLFADMSKESNYYRAILQNLFFATLNCPIVNPETGLPDNRRFSASSVEDSSSTKLMKYKNLFINPDLFVDLVNKKVPFLNGGLFDCLDVSTQRVYYDGFTEKEEIKKRLIVPDDLFFSKEVDVDLSDYYGDENKKTVTTRGLVYILKRYNFTIEENTPFEQEVSLDPELLGKVFENLLASFNEETQTTARKQTGSFYTPRSIVQYMVNESLVEHLKHTVDPSLEDTYRGLISYSTEDIHLQDPLKDAIMKSLYNCKVLDPACGSGAFPVGMLQQMVHILSRIDPTNEKWRELMIDVAIAESREAFNTESAAERQEKLNEINATFDEHLNYPDYARKLFLIENCIYGVDIQPIAIQISHLRFFISLVVDQERNADPMKNFGIRPLPNLEAKFVAANTLIPLEKEDLFTSSEEIQVLKKGLLEANHHIFSARSPQQKAAWKRIMKARRDELSRKMVENGYVSADAGQMINGWDMFDQNNSASFFDAEWMFGIKDGFDIVIGNPPYIRRTRLPESDKIRYEKIYKSAIKQYDIYLLFIEKGLKSLKPGGSLCYINPIRYFNSDYGEGCREFIMDGHTIVSILDVSQLSVFENAMTYPCVELIVNETRLNHEIAFIKPDSVSDVLNAADQPCILFPQTLFNNLHHVFIVPQNGTIDSIVAKIDSSRTNIRDYYKVARGLANNLVDFNGKGVKAIKSKQVDKYRILGEEMDINTARAETFVNEMIIMPRTVLSLKATYKRAGLVLLDRIYYLTPLATRSIDSKYVLGVINSKVTNFWFDYNYSSTRVSGGYFDLNGNQIKSIPLPLSRDKMVQEISSIVDSILRLRQQGEDTSELEGKIDVFVCRLYDLSYKEATEIIPDLPITEDEYKELTR